MNAQEALVDIGYTTKEARQILPSLFLYLFRAFNQTELYRRAREINPNVNLFKLMPRIPLMGDITLDDKVCIFALFTGENPGIKPNAYVKSVVLADPEVLQHLAKFAEYPAYTVQQVRVLEAKSICNPEIDTYMGKFIYRKMRFLLKSYSVTKLELVEQLQERAIHNLRINYPNWNNAGEMLAMAKSAIANAGHNLIKYYAATKRSRVDVNNKAVEYSLEGIREMGGDAPEYQALVYSEALDRTLEVAEANLSIDAVLRSLADKPNKKVLIELLSGRFDAGFSNFLNKDCTEYAQTVSFDKLFHKACAYIGLDPEMSMRFLVSLGYSKSKVIKTKRSNQPVKVERNKNDAAKNCINADHKKSAARKVQPTHNI